MITWSLSYRDISRSLRSDCNNRGLIADLTKDANLIRERVDCSVIGFVILIDDV